MLVETNLKKGGKEGEKEGGREGEKEKREEGKKKGGGVERIKEESINKFY